MRIIKKDILNSKFIFQNLGENLFYVGTFFLSSALPLALLFILASTIIAIFKYKKIFLFDQFNYFLLAASIFIIFSSYFSSFQISNFDPNIYNSSSNWVATLNWIPLFIGFRAFQFYLKTNNQKEKFIRFLIAGTFPVIFSMIMQYFFNIFGPFSVFNGLIIWFQKPLSIDNRYASGGVAGLFSNPNYTAYWLSCIFPFSIYIFQTIKKINPIKIFLSLIIFTLFYFIILTDSRGGFFSLLIISPFIIGWKIFLISIFIFALIFYSFPLLKIFLHPNLIIFIESLFERSLFWKISNFNILDFRNFIRIDLYFRTILLILQKPFFGWMAGSFSLVFLLSGGSINIQHAHNLPLQLAYDFGIITSILITSIFLMIFFKSLKRNILKNNDNSLHKYWFLASLVSIFFHLFDMPYYDGKIAILFWMLLAGLKTFLDENNQNQNT